MNGLIPDFVTMTPCRNPWSSPAPHASMIHIEAGRPASCIAIPKTTLDRTPIEPTARFICPSDKTTICASPTMTKMGTD